MIAFPLSAGRGSESHLGDASCAAAGNVAAIAATIPITGDQRRIAPQSAFSIASALETSNWPGCSTCNALTTPSSTNIE